MITEVKTKYGKEMIVRHGFGYNVLPKWGLDDVEKVTKGELDNYRETLAKKKRVVEEVMLGWDETRNYDRILDFECLRTEFKDVQITSSKENIIIKIPKKIMRLLPSPETYTRARRSLIKNADDDEDYELLKKLMPTKPWIIERRAKKEKVVREYFARGEGGDVD